MQAEPTYYKHNGYRCAVGRNSMGAWLAYVQLPPTHPWYGKHYDDVPATCHGGLTYAGPGFQLGENDWWIGMDFAHAGDAFDYVGAGAVGLADLFREGHRWTEPEVRRELALLVEQVAAAW